MPVLYAIAYAYQRSASSEVEWYKSKRYDEPSARQYIQRVKERAAQAGVTLLEITAYNGGKAVWSES